MQRFAVFVAILALALPTFAQQQPFQEQIDVNVVLVDAIVTDPKGNQILGLTKDDFVVRENGVEQAIESVDFHTNLRLLDEREQNAPFKVERVNENRYFIVMFDKPESAAMFQELAMARQAARKFIDNEVGEGDYVAILTHDVRLKVYSDFTNDKAQLRRALEESARFGTGLSKAPAGDGPSILRHIDLDAMRDRGRVYQSLDVLADALRHIRGRKNLVLFSPGILDREETVRNGVIVSRSRFYEPMIESLNESNVAVYTIQLNTGVVRAPVFHQRLEDLAHETGGEYFRFNTTFDRAINRIEDQNNGYYLITYRSRHPKGERGFQKIEVSLRSNPELKVTARSGYVYGE